MACWVSSTASSWVCGVGTFSSREKLLGSTPSASRTKILCQTFLFLYRSQINSLHLNSHLGMCFWGQAKHRVLLRLLWDRVNQRKARHMESGELILSVLGLRKSQSSFLWGMDRPDITEIDGAIITGLGIFPYAISGLFS